MSISESLLPEFDHEMANTRKSLERVPDDRLGWKPHPKSPTMGWLASHLAFIPHWALVTVEKDSLDLAPAEGAEEREPEAKSRREILERFDRNVAEARTAISGASDAHLLKNWTLQISGKTVLTQPRISVIRNFVVSHSIHHRAQLGVYFRLNDIPVPALYGPSADESAM